MVHYSSEFYTDDDLKDFPPISSFAAFMHLFLPIIRKVWICFSLDLNIYLEGDLIWPLWYQNCQAVVASVFLVRELKLKEGYIESRVLFSSTFLYSNIQQ